jgi:hypothetical protein
MFTVFPAGAGVGVTGTPGICTLVFDGAAGALFAGADFRLGLSSNTVEPNPAFLVAMIESESDVIINTIAEIVVAFDNNVADPRGPKAV